MTDPIKGIVIPITAYLELDGDRFELAGFEITWMMNLPAKAECNLSVGFKGDKSETLGAQLLTASRGSPAKIIITVGDNVVDPVSGTQLLRAGTYTAFDGLVDDTGPGNLAQGNFNLRVLLTSKLSVLATGTLQLSRLAVSSYLDTTIPLTILAGNEDNASSPSGVAYTPGGLEADFWADTKKVFNAIASEGVVTETQPQVVQEYMARFGTDTNTAAIAVLNQISGTLHFGAFNIPTVLGALTDYLNVLFTSNFRMESFYNRIVSLGQEFKFRVIEDFGGLKVVPYSPFFPAALATPIYPSTVTDMQWSNQEPNSILGCAMVRTGPATMGTDKDFHILIGAYKRPVDTGASPLGTIIPIPAPPWMAQKDDTLGGGSTLFVLEDIETLGNVYAKEQTLEYAYRGYGVQVMCPFRTDIGLGSPVRVLYPKIPGTDLGPSVYGSVQMVKLCMDAVKKQAYTTMEIGYARSDRLQEQELSDYTHPVWSSQYAGSRLDATQ